MELRYALVAVVFAGLAAASLNGRLGFLPSFNRAKVTIKVVNSSGAPLAGAEVKATFTIGGGGHGWSSGEVQQAGYCDASGVASLSSRCAGSFGASVQSEGYYPSVIEGYIFKSLAWGRWQPWDPVFEVTLKPVLNPVPLYAKRMRAVVPVVGKRVGFDLAAGDFVAPYGAGSASDIWFEVDRTVQDFMKPFGSTLQITFPNPDDGVIPVATKPYGGSILRMPHEAPQEGYVNGMTKQTSRPAIDQRIEDDYNEERSWFFRARTKRTHEGLQKANYGKIQGDIRYSANGSFSFVYYFNPTVNDRNLEFDPKRNLFPNLTDWEKVGKP